MLNRNNKLIVMIIIFALLSYVKVGSTDVSLEYKTERIKKFLIWEAKVKREAMIQTHLLSYILYVNQIGMRESSMNYKAKNSYGYRGKYQFGKSALRDVKIPSIDFLENKKNQEVAMFRYLKFNKKILKKQIKRYAGKTIHGIKITESGILAAAHLGGAGNVQKFIKTGQVFRDGYNTPITEYLVKFSNYSFDFKIVESRFDDIVEHMIKNSNE